MKLSVSLPDDDVAFIDAYAARGSGSRSAVLHRAVQLLRLAELEQAYREAADEWDGGQDAALWEAARTDGLGDGPVDGSVDDAASDAAR